MFVKRLCFTNEHQKIPKNCSNFPKLSIMAWRGLFKTYKWYEMFIKQDLSKYLHKSSLAGDDVMKRGLYRVGGAYRVAQK